MVYRSVRGCPACGDEFTTHRTRGYSYERCAHCCGVWINPGVLRDMLHEMVGGRPGDPFDQLETRSGGSSRTCPDCQRTLAAVELFRIPLDACLTRADGVWFDRDELRQVLERAGVADPPPPEPVPSFTSLLADFFARS